jgi:hypothetical protein
LRVRTALAVHSGKASGGSASQAASRPAGQQISRGLIRGMRVHLKVLACVVAARGGPSQWLPPGPTTARCVHSLCPELRMAEMGVARSEKVMMIEKIWMLLPDIQAMKHMNPMFLMGAVARWYRACMLHGWSSRERLMHVC